MNFEASKYFYPPTSEQEFLLPQPDLRSKVVRDESEGKASLAHGLYRASFVSVDDSDYSSGFASDVNHYSTMYEEDRRWRSSGVEPRAMTTPSALPTQGDHPSSSSSPSSSSDQHAEARVIPVAGPPLFRSIDSLNRPILLHPNPCAARSGGEKSQSIPNLPRFLCEENFVSICEERKTGRPPIPSKPVSKSGLYYVPTVNPNYVSTVSFDPHHALRNREESVGRNHRNALDAQFNANRMFQSSTPAKKEIEPFPCSPHRNSFNDYSLYNISENPYANNRGSQPEIKKSSSDSRIWESSMGRFQVNGNFFEKSSFSAENNEHLLRGIPARPSRFTIDGHDTHLQSVPGRSSRKPDVVPELPSPQEVRVNELVRGRFDMRNMERKICHTQEHLSLSFDNKSRKSGRSSMLYRSSKYLLNSPTRNPSICMADLLGAKINLFPFGSLVNSKDCIANLIQEAYQLKEMNKLEPSAKKHHGLFSLLRSKSTLEKNLGPESCKEPQLKKFLKQQSYLALPAPGPDEIYGFAGWTSSPLDVQNSRDEVTNKAQLSTSLDNSFSTTHSSPDFPHNSFPFPAFEGGKVLNGMGSPATFVTPKSRSFFKLSVPRSKKRIIATLFKREQKCDCGELR